MTTSLDRQDKNDPSTWTMTQTDSTSLEIRILAALNAKGFGATSVELDPGKLKGGYICDTMRVFIGYAAHEEGPKSPKSSAREEAEGRQFGTVVMSDLPKSVIDRPPTAILKMASPESNDHDVAMRLRLYEREWHFYEHMASRVPIRVPMHLGSVKDEATGLITEGVLLEDLCVPGAELCPKLDDNGVLRTVAAMAKQHAQFWNLPELSSGALGIKPHNAPWFQPVWGNDLLGYWPRFEAKWRARAGGDAMGPGLPEQAFATHTPHHCTPLVTLLQPPQAFRQRRPVPSSATLTPTMHASLPPGLRHRQGHRQRFRLDPRRTLFQAETQYGQSAHARPGPRPELGSSLRLSLGRLAALAGSVLPKDQGH